MHVRDAGGARYADREAAAVAGVCGRGDGGGIVLPPARSASDAAAERGSGERGGDPGKAGGREFEEQEEGVWRGVALCGGTTRKCRRTEPGSRGIGSGRAWKNQGR